MKRGRPAKKKAAPITSKNIITGKGLTNKQKFYKWLPDDNPLPADHVRCVVVLDNVEDYRKGQVIVKPIRRFNSMKRRGEVELWKDV